MAGTMMATAVQAETLYERIRERLGGDSALLDYKSNTIPRDRLHLPGPDFVDRVMINFYPGIEFFRALMSSTFIQETLGSYRPTAMEALPTVPILDRL